MLTSTRLSGRAALRLLVAASAAALVTGVALAAPAAPAGPASATQAPAFVSDRLSVEIVGSGPDVILIPGFASSREVWRTEAERLKATH
ncbi:MAG TPA: alpha/beta hydrolase, partial [Brevundimonas sp.]|nr:alpha/beta hydrolase [Brevundimonas sp.]